MTRKVSVLGLGNMGSALAAALLKQGNEVSVWNRSEAKADPLVAEGARKAGSPAEAIAGSDTVIICVGDYSNSHEILSDCGELSGKTVIQLTTGTVEDAYTMEEWVKGKGGLLLDGVIIAYPSGIGKAETLLIVAGSDKAWEENESIIKCLGGASIYVGDNLAAPIGFEASMTGPSLMAIVGMVQGIHVLEQSGIDIGSYADMMEATGPLLMESLSRQANAIANNDFCDTEASLGTWAAAVNHNADAFGGPGGLDLVGPIRDLLNLAVEEGYGDEEIAAVIKVMRKTD